jgi:transposase-like protein
MARGQSHPPEVKAAVMAALLAGQGISQVARQFHLAKTTVENWKCALGPEKLVCTSTKTRDEIGAQIGELIVVNLKALRAQSEWVGQERFLEKQLASELATLYGIIADRTFQILAALRPRNESEAEPPESW